MNNINLDNMWHDYHKERMRINVNRAISFIKKNSVSFLKALMTRTYNVDDISELLCVNKETVRRWLRSGELSGIKKSKKQGYIITETSLDKFLNTHPKYKKITRET